MLWYQPTYSCNGFHEIIFVSGRGDAILFYSQRPDGELDKNSLHGACPVLKGMKWGANLWVWNACRYSQCGQGDPMHPAEDLPPELKAPFAGGS